MTTTTTARPASRFAGSRRFTSRFGQYTQIATTVLLVVIMLVVGAQLYPNFTSGQALLDLLNKNAFLLPLAIGMTFVILSGGIDLSVGSVMALGSVMAATLLQAGWSPWTVIPVVLLAGVVLGTAVGFLVSSFGIQPFIATLASMFLARGLCLMITDRSIAINDSFFQRVNLAQIGLFETTTTNLRGRVRTVEVYTTPSVVIALALLLVAFVVLHYTRFGRTVYAVGGSDQSATLMGLAVHRTTVSVYAVSGFCAALSGLLFSFYTASADPLAGIGYELNAIAAVVIGGTSLMGGRGSMAGTFCGVLIFGLLSNILQLHNINSNLQLVLKGLIIVGTVLVQERNLADLMSFVRIPANRGAQKETAGPAPPDRTSRNPGGNST